MQQNGGGRRRRNQGPPSNSNNAVPQNESGHAPVMNFSLADMIRTRNRREGVAGRDASSDAAAPMVIFINLQKLCLHLVDVSFVVTQIGTKSFDSRRFQRLASTW